MKSDVGVHQTTVPSAHVMWSLLSPLYMYMQPYKTKPPPPPPLSLPTPYKCKSTMLQDVCAYPEVCVNRTQVLPTITFHGELKSSPQSIHDHSSTSSPSILFPSPSFHPPPPNPQSSASLLFEVLPKLPHPLHLGPFPQTKQYSAKWTDSSHWAVHLSCIPADKRGEHTQVWLGGQVWHSN